MAGNTHKTIVLNNDSTIKYEPTEDDYPLTFIGSALVAENIPRLSLKFEVLGALYGQSDINYDLRVKYDKLLDCMWLIESSRGASKYIRGDHGLAYGDFQIHIDKHPVSEECAMDYYCSSKYVLENIEKGNGWWWTSYTKCLK